MRQVYMAILLCLICISSVFGQIALPGPENIQVEVDTTHGFFGIGTLDGRPLTYDYGRIWPRG